MHYYPLNLNIRDRRCVVVGGGRVAERKVKTLLAFGAEAQVISPDLTAGLQRLADAGTVGYLQHPYSPDVLAGAFLAFTATNERAVNARVARDAHALGIPVNVADSAAESTFILPAILERGPILSAVSTGGRSPARGGIPFEVVPGVTSALAAPAYAGIPLTHRQLASTVGIVTGHEAPGKTRPAVDWGQVGRAVDTLVILMGVGNLPAIVERLSETGKSGATPVALIRWGTLPTQQVLTSTLAEVVDDAQGFEPPAVIVVGKVVGLRNGGSWFESIVADQRVRKEVKDVQLA